MVYQEYYAILNGESKCSKELTSEIKKVGGYDFFPECREAICPSGTILKVENRGGRTKAIFKLARNYSQIGGECENLTKSIRGLALIAT